MKYKPLTRQEEYEAWSRGDRDALVESQLPYAMKIAKTVCRRTGVSEVDDIYSAALGGLVRCVQSFDASKGFRLTTYATMPMWSDAQHEASRFLRRRKRECTVETVRGLSQFQAAECRESEVEITDMVGFVKRAMVNLTEREKSIVFDRSSGLMYHEIAVKWGISKARAEQVYKKSIEQIKNVLGLKDGLGETG